MTENDGKPVGTRTGHYCNFANSALACFRMGMSGSASFRPTKADFIKVVRTKRAEDDLGAASQSGC